MLRTRNTTPSDTPKPTQYTLSPSDNGRWKVQRAIPGPESCEIEDAGSYSSPIEALNKARQLNSASGPDPLQALQHLFDIASTTDTGSARAAAKLLLCLYNSRRFPLETSELRCFDDPTLRQALALLEFDARPTMEVHEWLNHIHGATEFGAKFEYLADKWELNKQN